MSASIPPSLVHELPRRLLQAGLLALGLACLMWAFGIRPFRYTLLICVIFSSVLWLGFRLLRRVLEVPLNAGGSALKVALLSTARMAFVYTSLLLLCVMFVRMLVGLDLFAHRPFALMTYLVGFTITVSINGFYLTQSLVNAERSRALAEADRQRQAQELETARRLQLGLLPTEPPIAPGIQMAWAMHTAAEVGGDHFDVYRDDAGVLHGAFGDATGHGMQAGMVVVAVKSLFRMGCGDPFTDLKQVGRGVRALGLPNTAMALTLWRLEGRRLSLAHAGMPPPLLWHAEEDRVEVLPLKAPPVGQLTTPIIATLERELEPGDTLLFYSDGLPECFSPESQMLGYAHIPERFATLANHTPQVILDGLWDAARGHAQDRPLDDDLSLFALRVTE